ncbi:hypothetical protein ACLOJK_004696 [Asimina triloba]
MKDGAVVRAGETETVGLGSKSRPAHSSISIFSLPVVRAGADGRESMELEMMSNRRGGATSRRAPEGREGGGQSGERQGEREKAGVERNRERGTRPERRETGREGGRRSGDRQEEREDAGAVTDRERGRTPERRERKMLAHTA